MAGSCSLSFAISVCMNLLNSVSFFFPPPARSTWQTIVLSGPVILCVRIPCLLAGFFLGASEAVLVVVTMTKELCGSGRSALVCGQSEYTQKTSYLGPVLLQGLPLREGYDGQGRRKARHKFRLEGSLYEIELPGLAQ